MMGITFNDDLMAWREYHRVKKKQVDMKAWEPPIAHFINLKPKTEQIAVSH